MADYDIADAFKAIEDELISSMIRNLDHHRARETAEGIQWTQWQTQQLKMLEKYKQTNAKKFGKRFNSINNQIANVLTQMQEKGGFDQERYILKAVQSGFKGYKHFADNTIQGEFFGVNDRKLQTLINATTNDMQKAETAVLRLANDNYRKVIFNAQVYAQTGGTYAKAVDMATRDMLSAGLNCIEYKNGARHTLSDYADMAIRTANKRAYLQGEGKKREERGIYTVILNKRSSPCTECLPFVGKVFIDDVWSGGSKTGISNVTGVKYPLLSEAIAQGLYHPRCKDSHTTYFEGINTVPEDSKYTKEELNELTEKERNERKINQAKNQAEKYECVSKYSLDPDNKHIYKVRAEQWKEKAKYYDNISILDKNNSNDIIKKDKIINHDVNVNSVPNIKINDLTDKQNLNIKSACEQLLTQIQGLPKNTEIAYCLDYETMKIVSSSEGVAGNSSVSLKGINKPFATIHNHPSNTIIGVKDIETVLGHRNEMLTMTIGNGGKFSALLRTKKANILGYKDFIKQEKEKMLYNNITFGDFFDKPQVLQNIPERYWKNIENKLNTFQRNIAKGGEEYGYKFIEI